jgi:hypothetical protein
MTPTVCSARGSDPQWLEQACASLIEVLAERYMELAESWLKSGRPERAAEVLKKLIQTCPETRQAQAAGERLRQLEEKT